MDLLSQSMIAVVLTVLAPAWSHSAKDVQPVLAPGGNISASEVTSSRSTAPRTLGARSADTYNVLDYGAFNDYGSHLLSTMFSSLAAAKVEYPAATSLTEEANVAAIQQALNTTDPESGGTVFIPRGGYVLNGSISIPHYHIHLSGAGQTETQLITNSTAFNVLELNGSYEQIDDLWINQYGVPGMKQYWAIHDNTVSGSYDLNITRVEISGGHSGIYSKGGRTIFFRIKITELAHGAGVGMEFDGLSEVHDILSAYMENESAKNAYAGILIRGGNDFVIADAQIQKMGSPLIVRPLPGAVISSIKVGSGSYFDSSTGPGILLDASAVGSSLTNITMDSPWASSDDSGVRILGSVNGLTMNGIEALGNAGSGIDASKATVITGLTINGGKISGNSTCGISIGSGLSNFVIAGVTIGPSGQYGANGAGICIAAGKSTGFTIVGNDLSGNTRAAITNLATGPVQIITQNATSEDVGTGAFLGPTGNSNSAYGTQSAVLSGYGNVSYSYGSTAWGKGNKSDGEWSTAHGLEALSKGRYASDCFASYRFSTPGDAQSCVFVLRNSSASRAAIRLTADGTGVPSGRFGIANCVNLPPHNLANLSVSLVGIDATTTANSFGWSMPIMLLSVGASAASTKITSGTPVSVSTGEGSGTSVSASADTANACLNLSVTPPNADLWRWVAHVQTIEVQ